MPTLLRNLQAMPRSSGAIVAATFKQALTRTLPATFHAFNRLGYQENIHYYVGRKAFIGTTEALILLLVKMLVIPQTPLL